MSNVTMGVIPLTVRQRQQRVPLSVSPGGGSGGGGTRDYNQLANKPSINGVTVVGAKTGAAYGLTTFWFGTRAEYNSLSEIDPLVCYCIEEGT